MLSLELTMSDQPTSGNKPAGPSNNNRRPQHHHKRRPTQGQSHPQGQVQQQAQGPRQPHSPRPQAAEGGAGSSGNGNHQRRRHGRGHHYNRPRNPNAQNPNQSGGNSPQAQGLNIERIYEKYLNLLEQHIIARRKYHDLFFRADPAQKNKLERNFYNTLYDIRDFESKLAPEARDLFEKRNNGLRSDNIYTTNHDIDTNGEAAPPETEWADPHYLQSQKNANFIDDKEESIGTAEDYLKYKNLL